MASRVKANLQKPARTSSNLRPSSERVVKSLKVVISGTMPKRVRCHWFKERECLKPHLV